jgi:pimeloyl-ACP methyl ester carboxylesterase
MQTRIDDTSPITGGPDDSVDPGTSLPTEPAVDPLDWGACDDPETEGDHDLECATLDVPLDHDDPSRGSIELALVRSPATGKRQGAVLFNPGGPGGSGFDYIAQGGSVISASLGLTDFDLVGFDPRGVDRSGGIRCVDDATQDRYLYLDDTPDTPEEQTLSDEADDIFVEGCRSTYGDTLGLYSTEAAARDMDLIRRAMGDDQISYLGISYGTHLGGVYATLFPERVRAMVLDSAFSPEGDTVEEQWSTQLVGFEEAFNSWAAWCQDTPDRCEFSAADVGARWDALYDQLDATPVAAADGRQGNQAVMDTATGAALYAESQWPVLGAALADAERGDVTGLFALADSYNARNPDGTFDTLFQSFTIIQCASGIDQAAPDDPEALAASLREQAPRFGGEITAEDIIDSSDDCDRLIDGGVEPFAVDYSGDGPIVVIGGTNDPATPIRWAEELTAEMGPSARLVRYDGEGHGQLLVSTCVTEIQGALLVDLELPEEGTTCEADPAVEEPEWWTDIPVPEGMSDVVSLPALAAALGVTPSLGYGEFRTTSLGATDAAAAYDAALLDAGFENLGSQDLGIEDSANTTYVTPDFEAVVLVTLGPDALASDDFAGAAGEVPPGTTVVLLIYVPQ